MGRMTQKETLALVLGALRNLKLDMMLSKFAQASVHDLEPTSSDSDRFMVRHSAYRMMKHQERALHLLQCFLRGRLYREVENKTHKGNKLDAGDLLPTVMLVINYGLSSRERKTLDYKAIEGLMSGRALQDWLDNDQVRPDWADRVNEKLKAYQESLAVKRAQDEKLRELFLASNTRDWDAFKRDADLSCAC